LIALITLVLKIKLATVGVHAVVKGHIGYLVLETVDKHLLTSQIEGFGVEFFTLSDGCWSLSIVSQA
jgi:hypothetical protein